MNGMEMQASAFVALTVTYLLEQLKGARWFPWLQASGGRVNALVGAAAAAVSSLGVHWTYDAAAGSLLVTGLTIAGVAGGLVAFVKQWLIQQFIFDAALRGKGTPNAT